MTRKSKREIERAVDDLGPDGGDGEALSVVFKDGKTGECYRDGDMDGDPVDPDSLPGTTVILSRNIVIMRREEAEREGREILGPAEDATEDAVRVRRE